jgi:hypothetical protein
MKVPTSIGCTPARAPRVQLTGGARIAAVFVLIAFAVTHLIGAVLMQRSSPANPGGSFRTAGYQD